MKARTRLIVAALAGLAVGALPFFLTGTSLDVSGTTLDIHALPLFYAAGLVTALTPCVYPLIPITVSIFGAGKAKKSRGHAAALSATYVLGIATMYSVLGLASAASGKTFGSQLGNPWVGGVFAVVMLALAASMFGAFELALPAGLQARLSGVAGFGFGSAFLMGLVCGIVAAPCTGPVLLTTLAFVAQTRDMFLGFWLLFAYAIGLGTPFFVLGTFSVSLPKSGAWMEAVKSVLGVMLLVVALSFVRPFLPSSPSIPASTVLFATVAGVVIFAAILLGTLDWSFHGGRSEAARKGMGVVVLVTALAFRLGWIVEPARACEPPERCPVSSANDRIHWLTDEKSALAQAKATGKPILVDFGASWCSACEELEHRTYTDPKVIARISSDFVPLKIDASDDTDAIRAIEAKYGVLGLPLITVLDHNGHQLAKPKIAEYLKPEEFLKELAAVKPE
jgi:thiol:disulfide interchange protein DsbD